MKRISRSDLYNKLNAAFIRGVLLFTCSIISFISWQFSIQPKTVLALDETSTPSVEGEDPVFPESTPFPESGDCPPLYDVPLALNPHDHFYFLRPIAMDSNTTPSPDFRYGYYYENDNTVHTGVDITSPLHKPVLAAGDGEVIFTGYGLLNGGGNKNDPYGLAVMIRHDFSYGDKKIYTVYAHLDRIDVKKDQIVKVGDQIGIIGMTGNTSGPHVHFEVRIDDADGGRIQNPELWLAPPIGSGVLAGRLRNTSGSLLSAQQFWLKSLETEKMYEIFTYANVKHIYADEYLRENFVIGDLPAGKYQIMIIYKYRWYRSEITIAPGTVNFIVFNGRDGFRLEDPSTTDPSEFL